MPWFYLLIFKTFFYKNKNDRSKKRKLKETILSQIYKCYSIALQLNPISQRENFLI